MQTYGPRLAQIRTRRPALSGSHSPVSRKRGLSMTRCNCESTSQATKFSRTVTTGSVSKRCTYASAGSVSNAAPTTIERSTFIAASPTDHGPQSSSRFRGLRHHCALRPRGLDQLLHILDLVSHKPAHLLRRAAGDNVGVFGQLRDQLWSMGRLHEFP